MRSFSIRRAIASIAAEPYCRRWLKYACQKPHLLATAFWSMLDVVRRIFFIVTESIFRNTRIWAWYEFRKKPAVYRAMQSVSDIRLESAAFHTLHAFNLRETFQTPFSTPVLIPLASLTAEYADDLFDRSFDDEEDTMAVHRFGWLLRLLNESASSECIAFCIGQITRWCEKFPEPDDSIRFAPYSISERLVSWIFFLMLVKQYHLLEPAFIDRLTRSFQMQLITLARSVEYHGLLTNNHVLNNARALYICGSLLNIRQIRDLGAQILFHETDRMIVNGALQEDSTHYQMLLSRTYLEIYHVAKIKQDAVITDWIKPRLRQMLYTCSLLQSKYAASEYPLFGDISPDNSPSWTCGYPFSREKSNISMWYQLFQLDSSDVVSPKGDERLITTSGPLFWHYLEQNKIELWVIAKNGIQCHGHNDNGSIVAYRKGRPVIADLGLINYSGSLMAQKQSGWEGHNVPLLDGLPPDIDKGSTIHSGVISSAFKLLDKGEHYLRYRVIYAAGLTQLMRTVRLGALDLTVTDAVSGNGSTCQYRSLWHIAAQVTNVINDGAAVELEFDNAMHIHIKVSSAAPAVEVIQNLRATQYGAAQQISTIVVTTPMSRHDLTQIIFSFGAP